MWKATMMAVAALLLAGCGGETEPPEVSITGTEWSGDTVTVETDTNLPDGAILSGYAVEGDDWDDLDAAAADNFATVSDGTATTTFDVDDFTANQAMIEIGFVPGYNEQPEDVQDTYDPNQGATDEVAVSRG